MRRRRPQHTDDDDSFDMTPMLDVVFIMLIFFIVTTSFVKESGVEINSPSAHTAVRSEKGNILIGITPDNQIWIANRQIELNAVRANIERLHSQNPEGGIIIQADTDSKNGLLVKVIDQARLAGISNISLAAGVINP